MARFLVSSINFHPDHAGIAVYATDLPKFLVENGHEVKMVTGFPYYPQWEKPYSYKNQFFKRERHAGIDVLRGFLYVPSRVTAIKRVLHEVTFCLFACANFIRAGRPDAIIVFSPPLGLVMVGLVFSWLWRCPIVLNIQDLPLEAATSLGIVRQGLLMRLFTAVERFAYNRADHVGTISEGMYETLVAKGIDRKRLGIYPNWIQLSGRDHPASVFRDSYPGLRDKTCIAYAGNLGAKQGVSVLLDLAASMRGQEFHFFVIGDGSERANLISYAKSLGLESVTFLPFMDGVAYQDMLGGVEIIFVAQRSGTGNIFFPSKLLGLMAAGKPVLVSADMDSELARVVKKAGIGMISQFGDIDDLKRQLIDLSLDRMRLKEMSEAGKYYVRNFERSHVLNSFAITLGKVLEDSALGFNTTGTEGRRW